MWLRLSEVHRTWFGSQLSSALGNALKTLTSLLSLCGHDSRLSPELQKPRIGKGRRAASADSLVSPSWACQPLCLSETSQKQQEAGTRPAYLKCGVGHFCCHLEGQLPCLYFMPVCVCVPLYVCACSKCESVCDASRTLVIS